MEINRVQGSEKVQDARTVLTGKDAKVQLVPERKDI